MIYAARNSKPTIYLNDDRSDLVFWRVLLYGVDSLKHFQNFNFKFFSSAKFKIPDIKIKIFLIK